MITKENPSQTDNNRIQANNVGKAVYHKARMRDYVAPECA